jgi:hypothetical protein
MPDTPDPLAHELGQILHGHRQHVSTGFPAPGICVSRCADSQPRWPCGAYRSASAVKALVAGHEPMPVYMAAVACGHDEDDSRHFENDDGEWLCQGSPCPPVCKLCTDTLLDPGEAEWPCGPYSIALRELTGKGSTDG